MPGRGSYGPGGKWIHDRAQRIMAGDGGTSKQYGDKKGKSVAYALATQQAHRLGKTPKKKGGYGTVAGRVTARKKFDQPKKEYKKTAAPIPRYGKVAKYLRRSRGQARSTYEGLLNQPKTKPETPAMREKTAASKIIQRMNGLLKCRQGRRPARVETLLKKGSQSGADLRLPVMGGTKFPTADSTSQAKQTLKENQNVGKPKMIRPVMQPVTGVNTMPKLGSEFSDDPLVQYLRKTAQSSKVDSAGRLDDNEDEMKTGPEEKELSTMSTDSQRGDKTVGEWRTGLEEMFSNKDGITGKYLDHHHSYKEGVVDKELKAHGAKV